MCCVLNMMHGVVLCSLYKSVAACQGNELPHAYICPIEKYDDNDGHAESCHRRHVEGREKDNHLSTKA